MLALFESAHGTILETAADLRVILIDLAAHEIEKRIDRGLQGYLLFLVWLVRCRLHVERTDDMELKDHGLSPGVGDLIQERGTKDVAFDR